MPCLLNDATLGHAQLTLFKGSVEDHRTQLCYHADGIAHRDFVFQSYGMVGPWAQWKCNTFRSREKKKRYCAQAWVALVRAESQMLGMKGTSSRCEIIPLPLQYLERDS